MQASSSPLPEPAPTDRERIAALERQVGALAAQLEEYRRQAAVIRSLEEIFLGEPGRSGEILEMAFAAGRARERGDTAPRPVGRPRPRHLRLAAGGES
jgi:hypothetical protein